MEKTKVVPEIAIEKPRELSEDEKRFKEASERLQAGKKLVEEKPSKPSKKKETPKKAKPKAEPKVKEKKPPKPLTLHNNYLVDIRRHRKHLEIDETRSGNELIVKESSMTVDGKKLPAIIIAVT